HSLVVRTAQPLCDVRACALVEGALGDEVGPDARLPDRILVCLVACLTLGPQAVLALGELAEHLGWLGLRASAAALGVVHKWNYTTALPQPRSCTKIPEQVTD